jgi:hypothetical protein
MVLSVTPAAVTVRTSAGLKTVPRVAVMFDVPIATPVARPPDAVIVATDVVAEFHVTWLLRSLVLASL